MICVFLGPNVPRQPCMWNKLRMFLDQYPDTLKDARLQNHPLISKEKLTKEVQMLQDKLSGVPSPIVFTHNDLLLANIVIDGDKVSFIDYEYGDYNYQVYLSCQHICLKNRENFDISFFVFFFLVKLN